MPELPEVETIMLGVSPFLEGATIKKIKLNRPDLRWPFPENFANRLKEAKGGALELSGAQVQTVFQTCDEVNEHLSQVKSIADKLNIGFIGLGAAPHWKHHEMSKVTPSIQYQTLLSHSNLAT